MSDIDEDLREDVNNALEDEQIDEAADNDQDDLAEEENPEDEADDSEAGDDDQDDEDQPDRKPAGREKTTRSAPADDDTLEDEDDDPSLDYARPDLTPGSAQVKDFDIRTLPKDPETGLIDPVEANRLISEHFAQQGNASTEQAKRIEETKKLLTTQWVRVSKKYPAVYSNPRLREMARDMHMGSIGTDNYLTPAQAAAKIERTRRELVKTGYKSAKTRRSVEKMTRTERSSGRAGGGEKSDYQKAKELANSRDPQKARDGRRAMLRIRREARKAA